MKNEKKDAKNRMGKNMKVDKSHVFTVPRGICIRYQRVKKCYEKHE
jgi:hypothetical protein